MLHYDYSDLLQLHLHSDASFDYDFDAHVAQCANVFGLDEKGLPQDDHRAPLPIILSVSDDFGSPCTSGSSRSSSIANDIIKSEGSDSEVIIPPPPVSPPFLLLKGNERARSFDSPRVIRQPSPVPSPPSTPRSKTPVDEVSSFTPAIPPSSRASVLQLPFSRKRLRRPTTPPAHISDEDADDESDNDTDDDYVPPPCSAGVKRRRTSCIPTRRSAPPIRSASSSPVPGKRVPGTSLSRNRQATSIAAINKACDSNNLNFICPECGWRQANKRLPDFKRHLRTHTRPGDSDQSKGWWCKGVLVEEAHKFNLPEDAKSYVFLGQERIGGCMQTFSRRDALKRHLDNSNVTCVGRPSEASED
ncbi:hypothetical protein P691DRAFT_770323 [Macrolepiota fuliginosa MF-IS2]|uniref:C2H2-type domain-containing protein n=1 Tax=Macrolepiota fuliginosa MF-IS2 TaxID=1400762 RepID=A0A9P5XNS8_9AGAR|nr:hypothetical protein P691DRAFT_770323 [Macrolepiota fuliginosa MF-IS2]